MGEEICTIHKLIGKSTMCTECGVNIKPSHDHQYTIPVEWVEDKVVSSRERNAGMIRKRVTKLRCICGAEISRED